MFGSSAQPGAWAGHVDLDLIARRADASSRSKRPSAERKTSLTLRYRPVARQARSRTSSSGGIEAATVGRTDMKPFNHDREDFCLQHIAASPEGPRESPQGAMQMSAAPGRSERQRLERNLAWRPTAAPQLPSKTGRSCLTTSATSAWTDDGRGRIGRGGACVHRPFATAAA